MANYYTKFIIIISVSFILAACEIIVPKQFDVDEEEVLELYKNVQLKDLMNDVQKKFQKAKEEQIYFYSPNNYRTARTGIQAARAYYRNPEKRTHVLKSLHRANKALDESFEVKIIVARELAEHIKVRDFLDILEAKKSHTREYRSLMTRLISIIERIENDKDDIIKNPEKKKSLDERKKDMMAVMLDFRLRVVKFKYLNHGEQLMAEADTYDARAIAPATYSSTIAARDSAVKYISENVDNLEAVGDIANKFQYEAQRLLHITRAVNVVMNLEKNNYEQYVLKQEERLKKIATALKEPELKYFSFAAQASKYASSIKRIIRERQDNALKVAELMSGGGQGTENANQTTVKTETAPDTSVGKDKDEKKKGLEVVPIKSSGDPAELNRSLRILTDQVFQLTVEKNAWEGERAKLKSEIKRLKAAQKSKPKVKPAAKAKPKAKEADAKKEETKKSDTEKKAESNPAENKPTSEAAKTN